MLKFLSKLFPSKSDKDVQRLGPVVDEINEHFEKLASLSDDELRGKTVEFRQRIKEVTSEHDEAIASLREQLKTDQDLTLESREEMIGQIADHQKQLDEATKTILDELLPEAFAVVKEACRRLCGKTFDLLGHKVLWDMVPFDTQLMGGSVLHQGRIAEMATGEGKTLVATMPLYLNALPGRGVHLVTVNDYLAKRDSEWMGKIYEFLGLKVGCIQSSMEPWQRKPLYECDIVYGTNNEFGFDYLRDNMVMDSENLVQREHYYAIVDEVDSVLVDEARTPLIISGAVQSDDQKFSEMKPRIERLVNSQKAFITKIVADAEKALEEGKDQEAGIHILRAYRGLPKHPRLIKILSEPSHKRLMQLTENEYLRDQSRRMHEIDDLLYYAIDERDHTINLTEKGRELLAGTVANKDFFVLPDLGSEVAVIENDESLTPEQKQLKKDELNLIYAEKNDHLHVLTQLLRAYSLYEKDDEYVVTDDGKVQIVDEFTGRLLPGRRYSDGLHQAIEAKEGVKVERDTQTLATITLQNYFRLYKKLAGMTGTAETEASEFFEIYKLDVVVIPTNKPMVRDDKDDVVYKTKREKYNAVITEIQEMKKIGRPVLVGTTSVEVSETLSRMLKRLAVAHNVLNAKQHQREAEIVQNAGLPGAITIATNMAGRGTDIKLGPGVAGAGGLHIIGTERHEARRIDRQLRGRSGRQGDPGSSQFYLSLEDDLMRLFGSDRIAGIMQRLGLKEGDVIQHPLITRSVQRAQKKVEENNFSIRKRLLEYDNVMNQQREIIYSKRRHALLGVQLREDVLEMLEDFIEILVDKYYEHGEIAQFQEALRTNFLIDFQITPDQWQTLGNAGLKRETFNAALDFYKRKEARLGVENMALIEKMIVLQVIDEKWKDHLREMDDLKEGIHLRAYGQKDPLVEYKSEAFRMFGEFLEVVTNETLNLLFRWFPPVSEEVKSLPIRKTRAPKTSQVTLTHAASTGMGFQGATGSLDVQDEGGGNAPTDRPQEPVAKVAPIQVGERVGRNDPCPCGSGKKYKQCHG